MIIENIKLVNFRSHSDYEMKLKKKTTLIVGENGSGKTSILEAIYVAMRGKSFRAVDEEMMQRGEKFYRIELKYEDGEKTVVFYDGKKIFWTGDKKVGRLTKRYRYPVVLFLPDDLHLVRSSPMRRRDYFDLVLSGLDEKYGDDLIKYNKSLKQRNEFLKSEKVTEEGLFSWNVMLAKYGCEVRRRRKSFVEAINERLTKVYRTIAENLDEVRIRYEMKGDEVDESGYLMMLERNLERDKILGYTSFGAHRDVFEFEFNGMEAEGSASRGEVRSMILAMKFIEAELVREWTGKNPVVLLDDVFSELDEKRQKCLVRNFKNNQVIITSVEAAE